MLRIGLLGASRIAGPAVIAPALQLDDAQVISVAASDVGKARSYADEHDIPIVEAGYAELIASDSVDLIYNALPPRDHLSWSIAAMQAGKHVLCEKPFAMNAGQAQTMVDSAIETGRTLIEAFHYRFHPLFQRVLDILRSGEIGAVRELSGHFQVPIPYRRGELRHELALGGGALMDLGCYPVHWVRTVMGRQPAVIEAHAVQDRPGVDVAMQATLEFPNGVRASVGCSMAKDLPGGHTASLTITGETGALNVRNPLSPHTGNELHIDAAAGSKRETVTGNSTYFYQLLHLLAVLEGREQALTGGRDAVANMQVIDAIYRRAGMRPRGVAQDA